MQRFDKHCRPFSQNQTFAKQVGEAIKEEAATMSTFVTSELTSFAAHLQHAVAANLSSSLQEVSALSSKRTAAQIGARLQESFHKALQERDEQVASFFQDVAPDVLSRIAKAGDHTEQATVQLSRLLAQAGTHVDAIKSVARSMASDGVQMQQSLAIVQSALVHQSDSTDSVMAKIQSAMSSLNDRFERLERIMTEDITQRQALMEEHSRHMNAKNQITFGNLVRRLTGLEDVNTTGTQAWMPSIGPDVARIATSQLALMWVQRRALPVLLGPQTSHALLLVVSLMVRICWFLVSHLTVSGIFCTKTHEADIVDKKRPLRRRLLCTRVPGGRLCHSRSYLAVCQTIGSEAQHLGN